MSSDRDPRTDAVASSSSGSSFDFHTNGQGPDALSDTTYDESYVPENAYRRRRLRITPAMGWAIYIAAVVASCIVIRLVLGEERLHDILGLYWPLLISPVIGWILGIYAADILYRPIGRLLVRLDVGTHMFTATFVPEELFRDLEQAGNPVQYMTPSGMPVYLVEKLDLDRGRVQYSWVHEQNSVEVMASEKAFKQWREKLEDVLFESMENELFGRAQALGFARGMVRRHLDDISMQLGISDMDMDPHGSDVRHPDDDGDSPVRRSSGASSGSGPSDRRSSGHGLEVSADGSVHDGSTYPEEALRCR